MFVIRILFVHLNIFLCIIIVHYSVIAHKEDTLFPCNFDENGVQQRNGRIVGGVDSKLNAFPFMISLTRRGGHYCGGVLINDRWILTAGHCVCNGLGRIMNSKQIKAVLGQHRISDRFATDNNEVKSNAFQADIAQIVPHAEYSCNSPSNDIALLGLTKRTVFTSHVQPACISTENNFGKNITHNAEHLLAVVSGWGWTNEDQATSDRADILQQAVVTVFSSQECRKIYADTPYGIRITDRQLCAGQMVGGIDSCWADSGGPLLSQADDRLIGIVSTGIGCARPGLPGIYTKVSEYTEWIQRNAVA